MQSAIRSLKVIKLDDGIDYFEDFLDLIHLPLVQISEFKNKAPPRYFIRHDVDHDVDAALLMAEAEKQRGYAATYYLLTPGSYGERSNYYGTLDNGLIVHHPDLINKCRRFIELGHQIGLHNDIISLALMTRRDPAEILKQEVDFFAANGVHLVGSASHGSPLARKLDYANYELFSECQDRVTPPHRIGRVIEYQGWSVRLYSLKQTDFGLEHEAYWVPRDSLISESGGEWGGLIAQTKIQHDKRDRGTSAPRFREMVRTLVSQEIVLSLQVVIHPCHWNIYDEKWNKIHGPL